MKVEKLLKKHKRSLFDCGSSPLNDYLKIRASQDVKHNFATVFVVCDEADIIAGFYTLCATSLFREVLSGEIKQRLPKYRTIPAILLGRLAVDLKHQGTGLGGRLLLSAFRKCSNIDLAWSFLVIDAKNERAMAFYSHFGFLSLQDDVHHLYLPRKTVIETVSGN